MSRTLYQIGVLNYSNFHNQCQQTGRTKGTVFRIFGGISKNLLPGRKIIGKITKKNPGLPL